MGWLAMLNCMRAVLEEPAPMLVRPLPIMLKAMGGIAKIERITKRMASLFANMKNK